LLSALRYFSAVLDLLLRAFHVSISTFSSRGSVLTFEDPDLRTQFLLDFLLAAQFLRLSGELFFNPLLGTCFVGSFSQPLSRFLFTEWVSLTLFK